MAAVAPDATLGFSRDSASAYKDMKRIRDCWSSGANWRSARDTWSVANWSIRARRARPASVSASREDRASSVSVSRVTNPADSSLASWRLVLDLSSLSMPARSRAWMPGCKPISMMACTAEGARSLPASEVRMKPSSRTSLREKSRRSRMVCSRDWEGKSMRSMAAPIGCGSQPIYLRTATNSSFSRFACYQAYRTPTCPVVLRT